jgi:hypothetical protein
MRLSTFVGLGLLTAIAACGGGPSSPAAPTPTTPSSSLTSLAGTWTGTSSDTSGSDAMSWTLAQNNNAMSGTMSISDTKRSMMGNGSMQGTVNGSAMTFHMSVPSGGFSGMMSTCAMSVDGQATVSSDGHTMTGTYSGSMSGMMSGGMMGQSCGSAMTGGAFTLTR